MGLAEQDNPLPPLALSSFRLDKRRYALLMNAYNTVHNYYIKVFSCTKRVQYEGLEKIIK